VGLCDDVRENCAHMAARARHVEIDLEAVAAIEPGVAPGLDPETHYLDASRDEVVAYVLTLDAINFGSGWFPSLRKRPRSSGYVTVAWSLAERFRSLGPWGAAELRRLDSDELALVLGQDPRHPLMSLYADALRDLGRFLDDLQPVDVVDAAGGSAERLAADLAAGMPFFQDVGFYKRAQIVPSDLALAGVGEFDDLDRLTIFADNVVPHVLRVDGVLRYGGDLAARIDRGELIKAGSDEEVEIRACAVQACELIAEHQGVTPRVLDGWLWNRGRERHYKERPRHRTRTLYY